MALDGIVAAAITHELQACKGARIHKIHQPGPHDLVLQIRGVQAQGKLLISANPTYPRLHWTAQSFINPLEAPMFCMLLRKYCEGGVIEDIQQIGRERVLHLTVRRRDELGDVAVRTIVIELMGRHSNIVLLDPATGLVHDGIHHVTPAISSYRVILPGSRYQPPPEQFKHDPLSIGTKEAFLKLWNETATEAAEQVGSETAISIGKQALHKQAAQRLVQLFSGISPLLARELVHRALAQPASANHPADADLADADLADEHLADALWSCFHQLMQQVAAGHFEPVIAGDPAGKTMFAVTPLTHVSGPIVHYPTVSACLEAYYGDKAERDTVKQRAADLIRFVQNERAKNSKKLSKLEETLAEAKDADQHRVLGELTTAYLHQITRGDRQVTVVNFYDEHQAKITIPLDPQLTPAENAQRFFKRYTKAKNSKIVVEEQLEATAAEIRYLDALLQQLEAASLQDIEEIREELVEQGYLRARQTKGKKKKPHKPVLLTYTSSEGQAILVGKNNTQNEYLTNRVAAANDTWLHTKDIPGSHVVIRGTQFGEQTLEEAAMLAAYYSQAKASSLVPVDYTLIRHVRKPSGAKPGFVIYDHQKTLFITPDEQRIKALQSRLQT